MVTCLSIVICGGSNRLRFDAASGGTAVHPDWDRGVYRRFRGMYAFGNVLFRAYGLFSCAWRNVLSARSVCGRSAVFYIFLSLLCAASRYDDLYVLCIGRHCYGLHFAADAAAYLSEYVFTGIDCRGSQFAGCSDRCYFYAFLRFKVYHHR